ncbi:MAG: TetR/AcrR family transcriptional regulator, partial [Nonomuraea sp.]|nr:TetR/AcrR family transcriptional regulator [Nonomuraea sp.]
SLLTRPLPGLPPELGARVPGRFLDVLLDGLRAGSRTPLAGPPVERWWD